VSLFFRLALLGGEPAWQVPHGFPFAIAGVACAFGIANVSAANVKKINVTTPTKSLFIAIAFRFCICRSPIDPGLIIQRQNRNRRL
jgi:hypothetical protein